MDRLTLQHHLDQGLSLAEIARRHGLDRSTVGKAARRYRLAPPGRSRYAAKPVDRNELARLIAGGATLRELSSHFDVTVTTIRKHLERSGLRTARAGRAEERLRGRLTTERHQTMTCHRHGTTTFQLEGRGYFRCLACRGEAVQRRRRKVKMILVTEAGGACSLCGYDRCVRALHFHHQDPSSKLFGLGGNGFTHGIEALRAEARKCVLLCSNCHAEVEAGVTQLTI